MRAIKNEIYKGRCTLYLGEKYIKLIWLMCSENGKWSCCKWSTTQEYTGLYQ